MKRYALFSVLFPLLVAASAEGALRTDQLRCEYRENPLGVDAPSPRLSWILSSDERGQRQTAYQIQVASNPEKFAGNSPDLWDSGKIASADFIQLPYGGKPLESREECFWRVRVWDREGRPSAWSETAEWTMGILKRDDWQAHWIGRGDEPTGADLTSAHWIWPVSTASAASKPSGDVADLSKTFDIAGDSNNSGAWFVLAATNSATAFLDGREIGGIVDPRHAQIFDLSPLASGQHLISIEAASGGSRNGVCGAIVLNSGEENRTIITDGSWNAAQVVADFADKSWRPPLVPGPALPILRKDFTVTGKPRRALIYICGLGQFELHINGQTVGDDFLEPGWTDYRKTCLYCVYDVTSLLKPGPNAIGVMLGNGMYDVTPGRYSKFLGSFGSPQLLAQLFIDYPDGTGQRIASDESWKVAPGPITFSSIYGGEDYDARRAQPGWDKPGFNDSKWANVTVMKDPSGALCGTSRSAPPIHVGQVFQPARITPLTGGDSVYDLGQNCAMVPAIVVRGAGGAVVQLTPGELLKPDGSVSQRSSGVGAWDSYTLNGNGEEEWSPRFNYRGCRYIQVHITGSAEVLRLEGRFITSSSPAAGEFSCSNELFNHTNRLIEWAIQSNMVSILTDCPHRERLGWLEQDHLMGPSLMYGHDIACLLNKITGDIRDDQHPDGLVADIAPEYHTFNGGFLDSPEWGSACVLLPRNLYEWYGDRGALADSYDTMKRYVDYLGTRAQDNIVSYGLGDWYDIGPRKPGVAQLTPIALTATAFYYRDLRVVADAARLLGHAEDALQMDERARQVGEAFNKSFYYPKEHFYATDSQTANALPVVFGLAPVSDVPQIVAHIVADMHSHGDALTAGDVGYRFVLQALAENGQSEEIFKVNNQSSRPGYGYQLAQGATSLTEAWNADPNASQDHFMLGHILEWFYRDLAGIQPAPGSVAFDQVLIKPAMVGDITWVKARYNSIRGPIDSQWKREGSKISMDISIPPGVTARVYLPAASPRAVTHFAGKFVEMDGQSAVFEIESGNYTFAAN